MGPTDTLYILPRGFAVLQTVRDLATIPSSKGSETLTLISFVFMINLVMEPRPPTFDPAEKALAFISRGWREVRDSAGADLQLMRTRARTFKSLADLEFENFLNSASPFSVSAAEAPIAELDFVKRIKPKLSEIRRAYSSPDFSRKVLERWNPRSRFQLDFSGIRDAIVSVDENEGFGDFGRGRLKREGRGVRSKEGDTEWEIIRILKTGLKEFERKSHSKDIFLDIERKSSEFVEKVKLSLVMNFIFILFFFPH